MSRELDVVIPVFVAELSEQLVRMSDALLSLEGRAPDAEAQQIANGFMRDAHSVKGTSASLGFADLATLAHAIEDRVAPVRDGQATLDAGLVGTLLAALEALRTRADALAERGSDTPEAAEPVAEVTRRLREAVTTAAEPGSGASTPKTEDASARRPEPSDEEELLRVPRRSLSRLSQHLDSLRLLRGRAGARVEGLGSAEKEVLAVARRLGDVRLQRDLRRKLGALKRLLREDEALLADTARELDGDLRSIQLVPLATLLQPLRSGARAHARKVGKKVQVVIERGEIQIDRRLFESMRDPLVHLLRNSVDHGLEDAEARAAVGKPEEGTITLRAELSVDHLTLEIADDGRGVDAARVRAHAISRGVLGAAEAEALGDEGARALIFRPGFSTAESITETSGRGVGLDVVASELARLGGRVELRTEPGQGTTFSLRVPLTLASEQVFLVEVAGRRVAVPLAAVERVRRVRVEELRQVLGDPALPLEDTEVRLVSLAQALGLPTWEAPRQTFPALVLRAPDGRRVAVRVDRVVGVYDAVTRPLLRELSGLAHLAGIADLGDGQHLFVLNDRPLYGAPSASVSRSASRTVLVVDDSVTTRALHRRVLETAGYKVLVAGNGEEGLKVLEREAVDLVVSDLEMPLLDGHAMLQRLRGSPKLARIPTVLVSSLERESSKASGAARLADAYVNKAAYERGGLLDTVKQLLERSAR
jgi:two-component system chemotaxis sensor kinase CheA